MNSIPIARLSTALAVVAVLAGSACSRDVPSQWPDSSPASNAAKELPNAKVTLALDSDPPLPGEPAEGWIGLEQPPSEDPHAHHRHHGDHAAPAPESKHEGHQGHEAPASNAGHEGGHHGH
jgi:hypothetical protein